MGALAGNPVFWLGLVVVLVVVYLLPTLIAVMRGTDRLALVFLVNLIGAPSGIGWFAAMILAFGPRRLRPAPPPPWAVRPEPMQWPAGTWDAWQAGEQARPRA
ncbi:MAG: superinfection immunity protein [Streptosporangiaceae bacterium]